MSGGPCCHSWETISWMANALPLKGPYQYGAAELLAEPLLPPV
jgi:hypothetical protein